MENKRHSLGIKIKFSSKLYHRNFTCLLLLTVEIFSCEFDFEDLVVGAISLLDLAFPDKTFELLDFVLTLKLTMVRDF